jgi:hypothetical protein
MKWDKEEKYTPQPLPFTVGGSPGDDSSEAKPPGAPSIAKSEGWGLGQTEDNHSG